MSVATSRLMRESGASLHGRTALASRGADFAVAVEGYTLPEARTDNRTS